MPARGFDAGISRPVRRHTPKHADGRPIKITFGEMREMGVRGVLVYYHCGHHVALDADRWPDIVRLSDLEPRSLARPVAGAAPTCGRTSTGSAKGHRWHGLSVTGGRVTGRGWKRPFDEPIEVGGRKLVTLLEAGEYITALPKKEHEAAEWRAAMEALLLVVERGGPTCSLASASCAR